MGHCQSCPAGPMGQPGSRGQTGAKGADGKNGTVITDKMRGQLLYLENKVSDNCIMDAGYCDDSTICKNGCSITYSAKYGPDCQNLLTSHYKSKVQCIDGYEQCVHKNKKYCVYTCQESCVANALTNI